MVRIILAVIALGIILPPFFFESGKITSFEIRYYVILALVMLAVFCFGILRLYNAIVANTRFLIKLQKEMMLLKTEMTTLQRSFERNLIPSIKNLIQQLKNGFSK